MEWRRRAAVGMSRSVSEEREQEGASSEHRRMTLTIAETSFHYLYALFLITDLEPVRYVRAGWPVVEGRPKLDLGRSPERRLNGCAAVPYRCF